MSKKKGGHASTRPSTPPTPPSTNTNSANDGPGHDGQLALALFDRFFPSRSWSAWRVWVQSVFALPMTPAEAAIYRTCTARSTLPTSPAREVWTLVGRRGGKSRVMAFCATFLAAIRHYDLSPGERGVIMVIAPGRRQATVILEYCAAMLAALPGVVIARRTSEEIELASGLTVVVQTASWKTPRGYTVVGAIIDEVAFLQSDSMANPDVEIVRALRPSLASVPGSLLLAISSPYAQRGLLWEQHERHYGNDGSDVLVWQSPTATMNPTINRARIDAAMLEDPAAAASEWMAEFRTDLQELFQRSALEACVVRGRYEIGPLLGLGYVAMVDPSGGTHDAMTLAVAHLDAAGRPVLDAVREQVPPFSPEAVCKRFASDLKKYGCSAVFSDAYAAQWPVEAFSRYGIAVQPSPLTRSELYLELVPMVNSGQCELLDHSKMFSQLVGLQRRTGRSGKDSIDHRVGSYDDLSNSAAGALVLCAQAVIKAPLPADFVGCNNPGTSAAATCAFMSNGPNFPSDPHCRKYCEGLKAVIVVYRQHQQRASAAGSSEPVLSGLDFLHQRFDVNGNSFVRRHATRKVMEQIEGAIGW